MRHLKSNSCRVLLHSLGEIIFNSGLVGFISKPRLNRKVAVFVCGVARNFGPKIVQKCNDISS